jgi:hypothetical protein
MTALDEELELLFQSATKANAHAASAQVMANAVVAGAGQKAGEGASARHLAATAIFAEAH